MLYRVALLALVAGELVATPNRTSNQIPSSAGSSAANPASSPENIPGVVSARFYQYNNQESIDRSIISRLNAKLSSRLPERINKQTNRVKKFVQRIFGRSEAETDEELNALATHSTTTSTKQSYYVETIENRLTYYLLNITLGTPPQNFLVQVDTGSSDLWVPGRIIQFDGFDSKDSSTYKHLSDDFSIKYVKDSAEGQWVVDTFGFGGSEVTVPNFQFAVATSAPDATMGILGIGPLESEVSNIAYPNLPIMLVRDGLIPRAVYSMYMGGLSNNDGTIIFGGSDKAKYRQLSTLPIVSKSTITVELDILALTTSNGPSSQNNNAIVKDISSSSSGSVNDGDVETTKMDGEYDLYGSDYGYFSDETRTNVEIKNNDVVISKDALNVLLDTGTSLTYLPNSLVQSIAAEFKAEFESSVGMYVVHQDDLNNSPLQGLNFQFQNQLIFMPKNELFWPLSWFSLEPSPYYAMTILASDSSMGYNILGDSFLRNAYIIYDLDEKEVHIGQYFSSPYEHIVPV